MTVTIENTAVSTALNIDELTKGTLNGTGVFDVLLQTLRLHLDREFTSGRITGTAYATVYSQALTSFLGQATAYCLSKAKLALELQQLAEQVTILQLQQAKLTAETSLVESQQSQVEAETAKVLYETTYVLPENVKVIKNQQDQLIAQTNKVTTDTVISIKQGHLTDAQTCQVKAETNKVNAEVTLKLPEEVALLELNQAQLTAQTAQVTYTTANLLPEQLAQLTAQIAGTTAQTAQATYTTTNLLPAQLAQLTAQTAGTTAQTAQTAFTTTYLLPAQLSHTETQTTNVNAQTNLYIQKKATELAQTVSTPAANSVMGVQNALMVKQTENYDRDAEQKAAKIMIDTWNVRRNQDPSTAEMLVANRLREEDIGIAVGALLSGLIP
jgi:hypothetical protein